MCYIFKNRFWDHISQRNLPSSFLESEKFLSSRRSQDSASNDCNFLKKCVDSIFFQDVLL